MVRGKTQEERKRVDRNRKRRRREEMREQGLRPYEVWVMESEWPQVKRYIRLLAQKRPTPAGGE